MDLFQTTTPKSDTGRGSTTLRLKSSSYSTHKTPNSTEFNGSVYSPQHTDRSLPSLRAVTALSNSSSQQRPRTVFNSVEKPSVFSSQKKTLRPPSGNKALDTPRSLHSIVALFFNILNNYKLFLYLIIVKHEKSRFILYERTE
jgi:hypothetical protein